MVFFPRGKAESIDTMKVKLMLARYQSAYTARALWQSGNLLFSA